MSTKIGQTAEDIAASYLEAQGWQIIARNWRNRWCEIDIVASTDNIVHIVEVKYRRTASFGGGFDYITPDKIRRLRNAAMMWSTANGYQGDLSIDIISVEGSLAAPAIRIEQNTIEG